MGKPMPHPAVLVLIGFAALTFGSTTATAEQVEVGDPLIFTAPTGRIIPSGVVYPRVGADTSASFIGSVFLGLGDVVEFGFTSTPYVRWERPWRGKAEFTDGYPLMVGRIGLNEGELWSWQPGVALGYRFGGVEVRLFEDYRLMGEYYHMPEFELAPADKQPNIELDAAFSLGLRSEIRPWLTVDVGVRGPDFDNLHQLDMEVFTQVIVPLRFLHDAMHE
jgi:hypothetical protein